MSILISQAFQHLKMTTPHVHAEKMGISSMWTAKATRTYPEHALTVKVKTKVILFLLMSIPPVRSLATEHLIKLTQIIRYKPDLMTGVVRPENRTNQTTMIFKTRHKRKENVMRIPITTNDDATVKGA